MRPRRFAPTVSVGVSGSPPSAWAGVIRFAPEAMTRCRQDTELERRFIIFLLLSFLVVYGYTWINPTPPPTKAPAAASQGAAEAAAVSASEPPAAATLVGETAERDVRLETARVVAVFTNRGARLKSWTLKDYRDSRGKPLDLVDPQQAAGAHPLPFSLNVQDAAATTTLNSALYSVEQSEVDGAPRVVFEFRNEAGLVARKEFSVSRDSYLVTVNLAVSQSGSTLNPAIVWGPGLGDTDAQTTRSATKPEGLLARQGEKPERLDAGDVTETPSYEQQFDYAGIDDHYFAAFALKPGRAKVVYEPSQVPYASDPKVMLSRMGFSITPATAGQPLQFYVGPKSFDTLSAIEPKLVYAINFGMFSIIVVPLLRSLNWIYAYVGNYGWAIFILTILINVVLFPLNHKSVVSMRKMQEIQPEAKAIQERYSKLKATDPARQKMNQELMALYRDNGVNPASGCVPILLTLPVFLAFYALLTTAIELRGAPFIGWIHDLSAPDPLYVMPVLVGVSQIVTQLLTPQPGADPAQQKMMMIMPVVLIFVFVSTPAGALIYWFVGNVWRLAQMQLTNYLHPPKVRVVRPAAERRVKRVGGGKTESAAREN